MKIFKNGVGRPSKEVLMKRRIVYASTIIILIVTILISGYFIVNRFNGKLSSNDKDAKGEAPTIKTLIQSLGGDNSYSENRNVFYEYFEPADKYFFNVVAVPKNNSRIVSLVFYVNKSGYDKNKKYSASKKYSSSKKGEKVKHEWSISGAGYRYVKVVATDSKGRTRTVEYGLKLCGGTLKNGKCYVCPSGYKLKKSKVMYCQKTKYNIRPYSVYK